MQINWDRLNSEIISCERCPRLRDYCARIAREKRKAFANQTYWGRPIPNMGDPKARLLIVGLAPAAHGGNRTGRVFTGDRSGDFLFQALFETGFANQPTSVSLDDGLELIDCVITAIAHCAPPENKPLPGEILNCSEYLARTFDQMKQLRAVVALGRIAFDNCLRLYRSRGWLDPVALRPVFGHGATYRFASAPTLFACFHPSQQNTFTGKLTPAMIREVFINAKSLIYE
jgi:uracil-DNA glycosylase family 4